MIGRADGGWRGGQAESRRGREWEGGGGGDGGRRRKQRGSELERIWKKGEGGKRMEERFGREENEPREGGWGSESESARERGRRLEVEVCVTGSGSFFAVYPCVMRCNAISCGTGASPKPITDFNHVQCTGLGPRPSALTLPRCPHLMHTFLHSVPGRSHPSQHRPLT